MYGSEMRKGADSGLLVLVLGGGLVIDFMVWLTSLGG